LLLWWCDGVVVWWCCGGTTTPPYHHTTSPHNRTTAQRTEQIEAPIFGGASIKLEQQGSNEGLGLIQGTKLQRNPTREPMVCREETHHV
jgi:hypothetical protein